MDEPQLLPGLQQTPYVYEPLQRLHAPDAHRLRGPNIGRGGCNLTITFLSMNRSCLSIKLLRSIREQLTDFTGEVLVVDQGSDPAELEQMRSACNELTCRWRIVELDTNYGVAGGRNRTMQHVWTEWVFCLDNDMVFLANPLPQIQHDTALLGCHFLNLPLLDTDRRRLFAKGGHLFTNVVDGMLHVGGGSVYRQTDEPRGPGQPFLSTFLFGGASVLNKATFVELGGYDEEMFIGFEDIDFSIRLFQRGYKIGNTTIEALVHDHPPPEGDGDRQYERQRYSREILERSAQYLQRKHGVAIWSHGVEQWLESRRRELGIATEESATEDTERAATEDSESTEVLASDTTQARTPVSEAEARALDRTSENSVTSVAGFVPAEPRSRPKVALIVDSDQWAFWNISQQLVRQLGDRFEFRILVASMIDHAVQTYLAARDCDVVHVFWREYANLLTTNHCREYIEALTVDYAAFLDQAIRRPAFSTCIYDHLWLDDASLEARLPLYRDFVDTYYVGSQRLDRIYRQAAGYPAPLAVLPDGVDPALFHPTNLDRFDTAGQRELVIGWTGNSGWGDGQEDYKGVHTILTPAVEQLRAEGLPLTLKLHDRAVAPQIAHNKMVEYYAGIDVYVCTSKIEGTPNPVLESMACGVPVISTDVGIVPEAFGQAQHEFILAERSVACLKAAIRNLLSRPKLLRELSAENLDSIREWYWERRAQGFAGYFDACLAKKHASV